MTSKLATRPHRKRSRHPIVLSLAGTPLTASAGPAPRLGLATPHTGRERALVTAISAGIHAAVLAALATTVALVPPGLIDKVIPVAILREPSQLPGSNAEPAPAGPKAVGPARPNAAAMASAAGLTPEQAAALRRAALEAARRAIAQVQLEADTSPTLPTQIERREVSAERMTARAAANLSPATPVAIDMAPMRIDAADLAALDIDTEGPRDIDAASLGDLTAPEALAALQAYDDRDYTGSVHATTVSPGATLAGAGTGSGAVDTGIPGGDYAGGGGGGGGGGGTFGAGTGGQGGAEGIVRCLESLHVQRYQEMMKQRTDARWRVPQDVPGDARVILRLSLDVAGVARNVEVVSADTERLGASAMRALLSASPFPPMDGANRCLADKRIKMTFTVPEP
ncbi:MAG: TonB C-terminal domain-containing protein [Deltaproteobacteria bacterium]|nr:TonB C-terminal domain-containing protein [Deltaproteobacteria bacterium]